MKTLITLIVGAVVLGAAKAPKEIELKTPGGTTLSLTATSLGKAEDGSITAGGSIEVRHGDITIKCLGKARVLVSGDAFRALEASGTVEASAGTKKFWGRRAFYDEPRRLLTISGQPTAQDGKTQIRADSRILYYTDTGLIKCEPSAKFFVERNFKSAKPPTKRKKFLGLF